MSYMYYLTINGTYIGTMLESAAHIVAKAMVVKVGDVATMYPEWPDDNYNQRWDESDLDSFDITCYHNGREVISFTTRYENRDPRPSAHIVHKLHTNGYSGAVSGFKYNRSDLRRQAGQSMAVPFMKRQINRMSRRVGKALIQEELNDTCTECVFCV